MANGRSDGSVIIDTRIDTKGFGRGVKTMQSQVDRLSIAVKKLGGVIATVFVAGKIAQLGKEAIGFGSDLQEVQNVVDVTFGEMSDVIDDFAKDSIKQFGLSELAAKQYASTMGAMLKSMGFTTSQAAEMSMKLAGLAGDMASFYNLDSSDAFAKLRAGISGETEPLKQLGINLSVANLEQFALAEGMEKTYTAMSEAEKAMTRYNYILRVSSQAQGDFARTSDSWANLTRVIKESMNTIKGNIGQALMNIFTPLLKTLNMIVEKFAQLSQHFVAFSELLVGKSTSGGGGSPGEAFESIEDGYDGIADATERATKAQNKYLTGLDEIRTFSEEDSLPGISGGNGVSGILESSSKNNNEEPIKLSKAFERIKEVFDYLKNGEFFKLGNSVSEFAESIFNLFSKALKKVKWKDIGNKIGAFLNGINWASVLATVGNFAKNIFDSGFSLLGGIYEANPAVGILSSVLLLNKAFSLTSGLLSSFKSGMTDGKFLTGFNNSLIKLRNSLSSVQKGLIGVVSVSLEFSVISDVFSGLVKGTEGIALGIGKVVGAAGLASAALYAAFGPAGVAAGAITAITAAIFGMSKALSEQEDIELFGEKLEDLTSRINDNSQAVIEQIEASKEYVEEAGVAEAQMAQDLADKYFDLSEKEHLTNAEKETMRGLAEKLVEMLPSLEEYYNTETGLIDTTRASVEKLIEAKLQEIRLSAVESELKNAYKTQMDATKGLNEALDAANTSRERMIELEEEYDKLKGKAELLNQYIALSDQIAMATGDTEALIDESEKLWNVLTDNGKNPNLANYDYLHQKIRDAEFELGTFAKKNETIMESLKNATQAFEQTEQTITEFTDMLVDGMTTAANNSVDGYAEGLENNKNAQKASYNMAKEILAEFAKAQDSHSPSKEFEKLAKDSIDGYNLGLLRNKNSTLDIITQFVESIKKKMQELQGFTLNGISFSWDKNSGFASTPKIPYLASGAVIPPNAPFMAVLGDQRHGTNIEAPLSTIESALDNVLNRRGGTSGSMTLHNVMQVNRRVLYDEFIEEAKLRMSATGRNPFDLA